MPFSFFLAGPCPLRLSLLGFYFLSRYPSYQSYFNVLHLVHKEYVCLHHQCSCNFFPVGSQYFTSISYSTASLPLGFSGINQTTFLVHPQAVGDIHQALSLKTLSPFLRWGASTHQVRRWLIAEQLSPKKFSSPLSSSPNLFMPSVFMREV